MQTYLSMKVGKHILFRNVLLLTCGTFLFRTLRIALPGAVTWLVEQIMMFFEVAVIVFYSFDRFDLQRKHLMY